MKKIIFISYIGASFLSVGAFKVTTKIIPVPDGSKKYYHTLYTGNVNYQLFSMVKEKAGKSYIKSIGLLSSTNSRRFSKRGWWSGGFLTTRPDIFKYPAEVKTTVSGVEYSFFAPVGTIKLTFTADSQANKLFFQLQLPGPQKDLNLQMMALPGDMLKKQAAKRQRAAVTPKRNIIGNGTSVKYQLAKDESWVYLYDTKNNPGEKGSFFSTCAVLFNPNEIASAELQLGGYSVHLRMRLAPDKKDFSFILWEFPGKDHFQCIKAMQELKMEFK